MKLLFAFSLTALLLAAADRPAAKPPKPLEIPAAAVESEPGAFHYRDPQGTRWIYYKTPFGAARVEERAAAPKPAPNYDDVRAVEEGSVIRFERPGPFGIYHWQREKSQLNEMEQAVWNRLHPDRPVPVQE